MNWTELILTLPRRHAAAAQAVVTAHSDAGMYIEDYADIKEMVQAIAHIDLIEEELLAKPKDIVKIHVYISQEENAAQAAQALAAALLAAGLKHKLESKCIQQEDWENSWKQYYHPIKIGKRLVVAPSWQPYTGRGRTVLQLDPGMAFGTGTHESTALCLQKLEEIVQGGETLLDIGTGSGILAVAALLLGAGCAAAIDIDPMAVRTAKENAQRNGVAAQLTVQQGDLAQAKGSYHIITANLVADAIIRLAPQVAGLLAQGGVLISSGVIKEREEEVAAALKKAGLHLQEIRRKGAWVMLVHGLGAAG